MRPRRQPNEISSPNQGQKSQKSRKRFCPRGDLIAVGTSPFRDQKMIKNPRKRILRQKSKIFAENNVPEPLSIFASKIENSQERCFPPIFEKMASKQHMQKFSQSENF